MAHRIEIFTKVNDTKSQVMLKKLQSLGFAVEKARVAEVFTINKELSGEQLTAIAEMLANPIFNEYLIDHYAENEEFDYALEIGFLPGVTDNIASTAKESIEDLFKKSFTKDESIHTSTLIFLKGGNGKPLDQDAIENIGDSIANSLIQRIHIKSHDAFIKDQGMDTVIPQVHIEENAGTLSVDLNISEEELLALGKQGIIGPDGSRRGPLALDHSSLQAIKEYFAKEERNPNDIELEAIAQTWSEHCKHTIFASEIDEIKDGLYKGYIKKATQEIRANKGDKDFCVSVFSDNAGGIVFDDNWVITDKAETHNSPSALDPFGGSVTGIVGVNRDTIGFGKGAKPVINKYGFCIGNPDDTTPIYRDKQLTNPMLPPRRILEGLVNGVNAGGNQSGIPTPQGFLCFDDRYKGKPLVFVGTVGLIPRKIGHGDSWSKSARPGDKIVVIGGRVGQDGIHGATFSSEALTSGSPATAVQIGDPITQKKLSDAIIKEVRDLGLYSSITDCGAGGISCSVAEMARESGGCHVELDKVPLKYPNLEPWKIWISESQERMTLAIPAENIEKFRKIMDKHGVEMSVIGEFNDSGRCSVEHDGENILDLDMEFLHDGIPDKKLVTKYEKTTHSEPITAQASDLTNTLHQMLERPNLSSFEYISYQYDYNVQGGSVIKPLQGKGKVNGPASVTKPFITSEKGIVCSQGINPSYSDIDTYHMAACAIDTAIRNVIAAGGTLDHIAIMDNFCWCSSDEPQRLGELKAAAKACYDYAVAYGTPYISGKDSMFNDFKGYDAEGNPIKISIPPTLLVSSLGVIPEVTKSVSIDAKFAGDLVYIIGETKAELGGSEYYGMLKAVGNSVPQVDATSAIQKYQQFTKATNQRLIASAISPAIGGLAPALAKKAIAGQLGMQIDLSKVPRSADIKNDTELLFSETQSRFLVTVAPENKDKFEEIFNEVDFAEIGQITDDHQFTVNGLDGENIIQSDLQALDESYRKTFKDF